MYELRIYCDGEDRPHYLLVDTNDLEDFRIKMDDDNETLFIEVWCQDMGGSFAINRKKVNAYSYKEVRDE